MTRAGWSWDDVKGPAPLRAPKFGKDVTPQPQLHDRPELCLLPVTSLVVDPRYQRPIGTRGISNIRQILERFDWRKFQPIVVTKIEDGRYAIIDGQHRATAALCHPGIDMVPCMIVKASVEEAAECFSAINGCVTAISPIGLFKARLAAGDEKAVALAKLCAAAGVRILPYVLQRAKHKAGDTLAIGAIERVVALHPRAIVILALRALRSTRDGRSSLVVAPAVTALCAVLSRNPVWLAAGDKIIEAIAGFDLEGAIDQAPATARKSQSSAPVVIESAIERQLGKALGPGVTPSVASRRPTAPLLEGEGDAA